MAFKVTPWLTEPFICGCCCGAADFPLTQEALTGKDLLRKLPTTGQRLVLANAPGAHVGVGATQGFEFGVIRVVHVKQKVFHFHTGKGVRNGGTQEWGFNY